MDAAGLQTLGEIAGIAGISLGLLASVFSQAIRTTFEGRLTKEQAYKTLRLVIFSAWSVGIIGVSSWLYSGLNGGNGGDIVIKAGAASNTKLDLNSGGGNADCGPGGSAGQIQANIGDIKDSNVKATAKGGASHSNCDLSAQSK